VAVVDSILKEELKRLQALRRRYAVERSSLPNGSVVIKKKGNHGYAYLAYRSGPRVVTDYIGLETSPQAKKLAAKMKRRREIVAQMKALAADVARLRKMISVG
jgi:hypothetical protein